MKTLSLTVSSFTSTSLSHCFSLLSAFLYSKPFRNNKTHCEIIDPYFNVFFVEIQLKKGNLKSVLWALEFGHPNRYTGLPNGLNTSLINGFDSGLTTINCGISQGSVLEPLLFLLYINDLNQAIKFGKVHHFADDTNLLCLSNYQKTEQTSQCRFKVSS